jgi:hypothetical protein
MTTALALQGKDARTGLTLPLSKSLASQDLAKHRAVIAVELEVLAKKFDRFGWERDRGSMAHDRMLTDWMDALQDYPLSEVRAACAAAVIDNPNRMPNEGHVRAAILNARKRHVAALPKHLEPDSERVPVDRARAAAIMAEAGFAPKRFGGDA